MSTTEHKPSDEALLELMREGNENAFGSLYSRWQRPIYRFALQMSGSPAVAEDVTQETFLAVIRDSSGYRASRGSFGSYLYGIARHMLLRVLGREKSETVCGEDELDRVADTVSAANDPHQEALRSQRVQRLWAAVLTLPVHYREVVVMCELHELDYAEVAKSLGCSIGTVRSRLHRGRALLAERLRSSGLELAKPAVAEGDGCTS
jgi:RNA polymerase sigma-70 factor (ECF subfamily)